MLSFFCLVLSSSFFFLSFLFFLSFSALASVLCFPPLLHRSELLWLGFRLVRRSSLFGCLLCLRRHLSLSAIIWPPLLWRAFRPSSTSSLFSAIALTQWCWWICWFWFEWIKISIGRNFHIKREECGLDRQDRDYLNDFDECSTTTFIAMIIVGPLTLKIGLCLSYVAWCTLVIFESWTLNDCVRSLEDLTLSEWPDIDVISSWITRLCKTSIWCNI